MTGEEGHLRDGIFFITDILFLRYPHHCFLQHCTAFGRQMTTGVAGRERGKAGFGKGTGGERRRRKRKKQSIHSHRQAFPRVHWGIHYPTLYE
jgi:hypothetical protein